MQNARQSMKHADPDALQDELQRNLELQQLLATLPDRVRHPVMVPVGSVAFFPGNLIHTNECLVDIGGGVTVEKSAKETIEFLRQKQSKLEAQLGQLKRRQHSQSQSQQTQSPQPADSAEQSPASSQQPAEAPDQILDIMEPYDESIHGPLQRPALKRQSTHSQHQPRNLQSKHQPHQRSSDLHQPHHKKQMQESSDLHQSHPKQQMQTAASGPTATRLANSSNTSEACNAAMPSHHSDSAPTQGNASAQLLPGPMQHEQLHQQSRIGIDAVPSSADDSSASNAEQACTTDDGDFERVMARFDDLAKQEAADEAVGTADADAQPTGKQLEASATNPGAESASTAAPAKNVGQRKASSGLKRGFFAGASRPKSATASSNLEKKAPQAKPTSQNKAHSAKAVDQTAFTGEIVEKPGLEVQDEGQKTAVSKPTDSSNHLSNKETPTLQAVQNNVPKRVSKFKMARSAG